MVNPINQTHKTVFINSNGIIADKRAVVIADDLKRNIFSILKVTENGNVIFAMPTYYDDENKVMWFSYTNALNNLPLIIGVDNTAEIVYYTGE